MSTTSLIVAAIVLGLISLDEVHVGQFMVSRPIVTGPLIGLLLGSFETGLRIGALVELIWLTIIPVGHYAVPSAGLAAASAVAFSAIWGGGRGTEVAGIALGVPIGILSKKIDFILRVKLSSRALEWEKGIKDGGDGAVSGIFLRSTLPVFGKSAGLFLLSVAAALVLLYPASRILGIERISRGLSMAGGWIPLLGVASLAKTIDVERRWRGLLLGFTVGLALLGLFGSGS